MPGLRCFIIRADRSAGIEVISKSAAFGAPTYGARCSGIIS